MVERYMRDGALNHKSKAVTQGVKNMNTHTHNIGKCFLLLRQCAPTLSHVNRAGDLVSNTTTQEVKFHSFQSVNVMLNVGRFNRSVKP